MENVFSNRLIAARKMAGLSLQGLSDKLDNAVTKQSLNKYEQGVMRPDSQLLIALAGALAVTVDYFYSTPSVLVELTNVSYRKYSSKLTKAEEVSVEEKAKEGFERYFELEEVLIFQLPQYH
jgi:transcriptional regulator with XRE-family HTH domain